MKHTTTIKVRGHHCDFFQHVNNARYLEFLEEGRWDYLEKSDAINFFTSSEIILVLANININYRSSALLGQTLIVHTFVIDIGKKSTKFRQEVYLNGAKTPIVDADLTMVLTDLKKGISIPIEGEIRKWLENQLHCATKQRIAS